MDSRHWQHALEDRPQADQHHEQFEKICQTTIGDELLNSPEANSADDADNQNPDQECDHNGPLCWCDNEPRPANFTALTLEFELRELDASTGLRGRVATLKIQAGDTAYANGLLPRTVGHALADNVALNRLNLPAYPPAAIFAPVPLGQRVARAAATVETVR